MKVLDSQIVDSERVPAAEANPYEPVEDVQQFARRSDEDLHFDLALWARGLESFCSVGRYSFRDEKIDSGEKHNFRSEFQISNAVLVKCGELIEELSRCAAIGDRELTEDVADFRRSIKALIICNNALVRDHTLNFAEWNSWSELVAERLGSCEMYLGFDAEFERRGLAFLPELLKQCLASESFDRVDREDLLSCLSKLGGIIRALEVVRDMLNSDSPLKPALTIFAFIFETVNELIFEIGERLSAREDETGDVFAMLDATAYTLTIELKKVYTHELSAVVGTRSASFVCARTEATFGLLNDNIRHLLAGFAKLAEPETDAMQLFPEFVEKLEQSIELRSCLWSILNAVRSAEVEVTDDELRRLRPRLEDFLDTQLHYLFYKDRDTFERFCEEIMTGTAEQDFRPLLHRFSAYVETLANQVGMRVVLANHPFIPGPDVH